MKMIAAAPICFSFFLTLYSCASASEDCSAALLSDTTSYRSNWYLQYAAFQKVSRQEYEELKKDGKLSSIFDDIPIDASYDEANDYFNTTYQQQSIDLKDIGSTQILTSRLSENSVRAYTDCLQLQGNKAILLAWLDSEAPDYVRIAYRWSPSPQQALQSFVIKNFDKVLDTDFPNAGDVQYINIKRTSGETLSLTFKASLKSIYKSPATFVSYSMLIPWLEPVKTKKEIVERGSGDNDLTITWGNPAVGGATIPFSYTAAPGYFIEPGSVSFSKTSYAGSCPGYFGLGNNPVDNQPAVQPTVESRKVSGFFRATTAHDHCGFTASAKVTWHEWRPLLDRVSN